MPNNIFVDSCALFALLDNADAHFKQAKAFFLSNKTTERFVTSDYVFIESWTLIHHKLGKHIAQIFWKNMRTGFMKIYPIAVSDLDRAWEISNQYVDQDFSLVDCTSFALMERLKIDKAFTFDEHFRIFRTKNNKSFQVVPH
ncbi:PIN domain-containing protein [candidate division KSB1 bacterium]|nr:PIN domain-containing protein [candidate division KSB1 bacterium]